MKPKNRRTAQYEANRRAFMQRLGAGALALPFLESFPNSASAATPPVRLFVMYMPSGMVPHEWINHGDSKAAYADAIATLGHQSRVLHLRNLHFGRNSPQNHADNLASMLSCRERLGSGPSSMASGPTVDSVIASRIGGGSAVRHLAAGNNGFVVPGHVEGQVSYAGNSDPIRPKVETGDIFDSLFGNCDGGTTTTTTQDDPVAKRRRWLEKSVLDTSLPRFSALADRLGSDGAGTIRLHEERLREIEKSVAAIATETEVTTTTGCVPPPRPSSGDFSDMMDAHFDMAAAAFAGDRTRVYTYQPDQNFYNGVPVPGTNATKVHSLSHWNASGGDSYRQQYYRVVNFYMSKVKHFLDTLESYQDGNGSTVLDNTMVLLCTETSSWGEGFGHDYKNVPMTLIGNPGNHWQTGRTLDCKNEKTNRLFLSMFKAFGISDKSFGDPSFAQSPMPGM